MFTAIYCIAIQHKVWGPRPCLTGEKCRPGFIIPKEPEILTNIKFSAREISKILGVPKHTISISGHYSSLSDGELGNVERIVF